MIASLENGRWSKVNGCVDQALHQLKSLADRIHPTDIRLRAYMAIAEQAIQPRY